MRLRIDLTHETTQSGGKAIRAEEGDIDAFLCWGHVPSLVQTGFGVPEQFTGAHYFCDLEVYDEGVLVIHKERAFPSAARAKAWFRFVAWCLSRLSARDMTESTSRDTAWRLS